MKKRKPRLTREDVFGAADAVLRKGKKPSIENVLAILKRGSPNTAGKYLALYWRSLYTRIEDAEHQRLRLQRQIRKMLDAMMERDV